MESEDGSTADVSNRELLDSAIDLRRQIEQREARLLEQVAEIDRRRAYEEDGAVTTVGWLRHRCRLDSGRAGQLVRLARAGDSFPDLRHAHLQGRISGCEARRIAQGAETYRRDLERHGASADVVEREVGDLQSTLLASAETGSGANDLRREIDSHRHRLAAESMVHDEWAAFQQREVHLYTTFDGMVDLRGTLDPASAATVRSAIESLDRPSRETDGPTAGQRRADALVQLARNVLDNGLVPGSGRQRPHVTVTVSERTLHTDTSEEGASPGELRGGGPCSGETARLLACDGEATRIVHGTESEVLDVGRATRVVSRAMHKALSFRDGGCAHPQCDRPVEWCDAHHVQHWAQGGPTALENLVLLCRRHHTEIHLRGTGLRWEGGELRINEPPATQEPPGVSGADRLGTAEASMGPVTGNGHGTMP